MHTNEELYHVGAKKSNLSEYQAGQSLLIVYQMEITKMISVNGFYFIFFWFILLKQLHLLQYSLVCITRFCGLPEAMGKALMRK